MFDGKKQLEYEIIELKNDIQELTDFICLCIDNLPQDVKNKQIAKLVKSHKNKPNYKPTMHN